VLGVGTTVIPLGHGDLGDYLASLEKLLAEAPGRIYPAHGPAIDDGPAKLREYLAHRRARERQILAALRRVDRIAEIVKIVYAAYPEALHAAAGQSVASHLVKLEREGRVRRTDADAPLAARWTLA
jgi:glyoxylase-like metal-dependent hydrolase (beta-lactamase superfamily II)